MINNPVKQITEKALGGGLVTRSEAKLLFEVPVLSEEFFYIQYAAREISQAASRGFAEIHAQVGLNSGPCPENCAFCSFAAVNGIFAEHKELPFDEVIQRGREFEQAGANAIYLMSTAIYDFEKFLTIGKMVRSNLQPDTVLIANTGDLNYHQAAALKEAGFSGVYHAIRMGEERFTGLSVQQRLKTFQAVKDAGLLLGTCVEPVGQEHSSEELVEKTFLAKEARPVYSGSARRIPIPGTDMGQFRSVSETKMAHILAVVRLAMGYEVPGNCTHEPNILGAYAGANLVWAETGSNPRDTRDKTETGRGFTVNKCREILEEAEWPVLTGPSVMFGKEVK